MELQEIWYTDEGSAPMVQTDAIRAVEGGLEGDRYQRGTGHYTPFDVCEVTLVESEALETISAEYGIDLTDGRHRRNLVLSGVDVHEQLLDHRFRIGDAVFEGTRPRPPCPHVEDLAGEEGVARALGEGRGGVCADVVDPGRIRAGDAVEILESTAFDAEGLVSDIRDRVSTER